MKLLVLPSPWARCPLELTESDTSARPQLLVQGGRRSVRVVGSNLDLPRLGSVLIEGESYSRFELLGPGMDDPGADDVEFEIEGHPAGVRLRLREGLQREPEENGAHKTPGNRTQSFLGRHVELLGEPVEAQLASMGRLAGGCASVDLREFLDSWNTSEEGTTARLALIVRIAEAIGGLVDDLCKSPRRILRRERSLQRVASVRQIDPAGVRWLVRQPGKNLVQRAGPRQRVLAVVREESFDTHENRVLRDMLERSRSECRGWMQDNEAFRGHRRHENVRHYSSVVRRHRRLGPISGLPGVHGTVKANYVLQHDQRYARVWPWYQKLRRKQQEEDNLWRWSHRTFAESVRLSLAWALDLLEEGAELPPGVGWARDLFIRAEQRHGALLDPRSRLTGWILSMRGEPLGGSLLDHDELRILEQAVPGGSRLHELAPDALVCSHSIFRTFEAKRAVLVWCRLRFGGGTLAEEELRDISDRIASCSGRIRPAVLVVEPGEHGASPEIVCERLVPAGQGEPISVLLVRVPLRLDRSRELFASTLRPLLLEGVG